MIGADRLAAQGVRAARAERDVALSDKARTQTALRPPPPLALPAPWQSRRDGPHPLRVAAAMAALPVRQREALVLQYYQELSNGEAAALMDISIEALESLLSRARRNLRAQLMGNGKEKP